MSRLRDGTIVVANGGSKQLRYFDSRGQHIRTVGRQGQGPGELQNIAWMRSAGDSLFVFDPFAARLSVFSSAGGFVQSQRVEPPDSGLSRTPIDRLTSGELLATIREPTGVTGQVSGIRSSVVHFVRLAAGGALLNSITSLPGPESYVVVETSGVGVVRALLSPTPSHTVATEGIHLTSGRTYEIRLFSERGELRRVLRRTGTLPLLNEEEVATLRRARLEPLTSDVARRQLETAFAAMGEPESRPAYVALLSDSEGNLWAQRAALSGEAGVWEVFQRDGSWIGALSLPAGFKPTQIGADFVVGVSTDELDVQRVQLNRLIKS